MKDETVSKPARRFQFPLHRGMSSGILKTPLRQFLGWVSIPSSSGHVIGRRAHFASVDRATARFNPLFIGACHRATGHTPRASYHSGQVSIPSSSGHVIGRENVADQEYARTSFNPLFIGACHRAGRRRQPRATDSTFQSPLHRGMSSGSLVCVPPGPGPRVSIPSSSGHVIGHLPERQASRKISAFQSPLHRGMSSGDQGAGPWIQLRWTCFNPLFIGACHRAVRVSKPHAGELTVSIPSSSGHVIGHGRGQVGRGKPVLVSIPSSSGHVIGLEATLRLPNGHSVSIPSSSGHVIGRRPAQDQPGRGQVSIPSSSGHVIGRMPSSCSGLSPRSFNPLFIGACHRAAGPTAASRRRAGSFNPLFIGACHRACQAGPARSAGHPFQSPLHRGMSSGLCPKRPRSSAAESFNPLFIGACHRACGPTGIVMFLRSSFNPLFIGACHRARGHPGPAGPSARVSIPSSSGHVIGLGSHVPSCHHRVVSIPSSSGHVIGRPFDMLPE